MNVTIENIRFFTEEYIIIPSYVSMWLPDRTGWAFGLCLEGLSILGYFQRFLKILFFQFSHIAKEAIWPLAKLPLGFFHVVK